MTDLEHLFAISDGGGFVSLNRLNSSRNVVYVRTKGAVFNGERILSVDEMTSIANALIAKKSLLILGAGVQIEVAADSVTLTLASVSPPNGNGHSGTFVLSLDQASSLGNAIFSAVTS